MANARAHIFISGRVQGVFYRSTTKHKATKYGIKGWIRNLQDGRVEAVFEGEETDVNRLVRFCRKGSPWCRVDNIEVYWESYTGDLLDFRIL